MQSIRKSVSLEMGERLHITPVSDVHLDSPGHASKSFWKMVESRKTLPNHRFVLLGDFLDLILPTDMKRFTMSGGSGIVADELLNLLTDKACSAIEQMGQVDMYSIGNHELASIRHNHYSVTQAVCDRLKISNGGYSGYLRYAIKIPSRKKVRNFNMLYHHGKWGGSASRGLPGLRRWASSYDSWDVALAGHNHYMMADADTRTYLDTIGRMRTRKVRVAFCGGYLEHKEDNPNAPGYAEVAGLAPSPIGSPLVTVWIERDTVFGETIECNITI